MIIFLSVLYSFVGVTVFAGLFEERYSLGELLVAGVMAIVWPIALLGMSVYKFTRFLNDV